MGTVSEDQQKGLRQGTVTEQSAAKRREVNPKHLIYVVGGSLVSKTFHDTEELNGSAWVMIESAAQKIKQFILQRVKSWTVVSTATAEEALSISAVRLEARLFNRKY